MKLRLLGIVCLAFTLGAAPVPEDKGKKTHAALQGKWVVIKAEMNDVKLELPNELSLTFEKDSLTTKGKEDKKGSFKIDTTKTPMEIDFLDGDQVEARGIFEVDGDKLKICMGGRHSEGKFDGGKVVEPKITVDPRPTKFDSKLGMLAELKREKK